MISVYKDCGVAKAIPTDPLRTPRGLPVLAKAVALVLAVTGLVSRSMQGANTVDNYTGSATGNVTTPGNWSLGTVPTITNDAVFPVGAATGIRNFGTGATPGANLVVGSLDDLSTGTTVTIRNDTSGAPNVSITLGGAGNLGNSVSGTAADLFYVASGGTFNIDGANGGGGTGVLRLILGQSGNFNIAGTSTISSVISGGFSITKTGAGTLALSGSNTFTGGVVLNSGTLSINQGPSFGATPGSAATQLTFTGNSTLQLTADILQASAVNTNRGFLINNGVTATFDTQGFSIYTNNGISAQSGQTGVLNKIGTGTLFLGNTNSGTDRDNSFLTAVVTAGTLSLNKASSSSLHAIGGGGVTVNAGTLNITGNGGDQIYDAASVTMNGGTFNMLGNSETIGSLGGTGGTVTSSAAAALTVGGSLGATGSGSYSGVISGAVALIKAGSGTMTLSGSSTYTGATTVNGGTLALQSSGTNTSVLSSSSALILGGASLTATNGTTSGTGTDMVQSVAGLTLNSGSSSIALAQGTATNNRVVLNLGAITRNLGSTINFTLPAGTQSSTNGITTTTANTATSILGGWATVGLNDWAVSGGNGSTAGNISALSSYFTYDNVSGWLGAGAGPTSNMTDSNGYDATYTNSITLNSLRFNASASDSNVGVVSGQNITLGSGGLLVTNNVGGKYQRIGFLNTSFTVGQGQGGLTLPGSGDLVINQNNSGSGHLEIYSTIFGTGVNLVKSGVGFLDLRGLAASYTGTTTIDAGTLQVSGGDDRLPTSTAMTINAGTLNLAGVNQTLGGLTGSSTAIVDHSGTNSTLTVNLASGTNTYGGVIQNTAGTLGLTKSGAGTEALSGANTYTGTTLVTGTGKLEVANNSSSTGGRLTATTAITVNNGGTLLLSGVGSADRINNAAGVTLGSTGTNTVAAAGGAKEGSAAIVVGGTASGTNAFGIGALTLTSASKLDFDSASNGNLLVFNGFSGSATLTITNWTNSNYNGSSTSGLSTDDRLVFNQNMSGFLSQFDFGSGAGVGVTEINLGGIYYEVGFTPVPEPSTVAAASLLLGLLVYRERKLLKARWKKVAAASLSWAR